MDEAFRVLDEECAWSRRGKRPAGGWIRTSGLIAQAARHTTNRANEMHLHTHVAVANMVECVDGEWRTPDSEFLFQWRPAATAAYARRLYSGLEELGIEMTAPNRHGVREVAAIPDSLLGRFSTRTNVILDEAEELAMARAAKGGQDPRWAQGASDHQRQHPPAQGHQRVPPGEAAALGDHRGCRVGRRGCVRG